MIEHGTQFWRDAWIAAEFGKLSKADQVRLLHPEPFPDFAARFGSLTRHFEATEAMLPRRRGDEYREDLEAHSAGQTVLREHPSEQWLTASTTYTLLKRAAAKKAEKPYAPNCSLIIYLNESDYGSEGQQIEEQFKSATEIAARRFQSVHILWGSKLHTVWE
ncbi:hypothetical protein GCM10009127_04050 [Alteraurantiacibacter aestuarii]|uniref:Uncharacterized protein n=1 Tax=Alteraurantiacibacter aestuarii TaxID=650004 RepID=A0A844ZLA2_9SPHN|nr:hypothetical protein [Alteraurantiacibacter aestuarii]MXO88344.1 hypothetical protein [Alteraurantiacibacter aestuarii]